MTVLLGPSPEVAGRETALDVPLAQSVGGTLKLVLAHFAGSGADSYLAGRQTDGYGFGRMLTRGDDVVLACRV